jgi:hypothetical protein
LTIAPTVSSNLAESKTVVATVAASANYTVAAPGNATLTIVGNTVPKPALKMNSAGPSLSWVSAAGAKYRIAHKTSLADAEWTYLPNTVTSTGSVTTWTDTDKASQRFYLIIRIQ